MGYLDGSTITVDAILTGEGRKKLANGGGLGITKFSLGDDGVDYKLWNVNHASGSTYYVDLLSNGFKPRTTWEGWNGSGYRILYIAFAENPFKYATAR